MMTIIVGLGNPGTKFENTRHNVGFMAVDAFAKTHEFPEFKLQKKSNALVSEKGEVLLAKPQTFMNESGKAVRALTKNSVVIVHDDIDLALGKIKIVKDRGSAGHKGVESIIKAIGNENLIRIRIGIAPAGDVKADKIVLKKFSPDEQKIISETLSRAVSAIDLLISQGLEKAMGEFN